MWSSLTHRPYLHPESSRRRVRAVTCRRRIPIGTTQVDADREGQGHPGSTPGTSTNLEPGLDQDFSAFNASAEIELSFVPRAQPLAKYGCSMAQTSAVIRGTSTFHYDPVWAAAPDRRPLSLSLDFTPNNAPYKGPVVVHYFEHPKRAGTTG